MANRTRSKEKEEFWRLVLQEYESFGGTVREYCRREGLAENSFYGWRRELARRDAEAKLEPNRLLPVKIVESAPVRAKTRLEIRTPGGLALRLQDSVGGDRLSDLVSALLKAESEAGRC